MSGLRFESMADMPPRMRELYARQQMPGAAEAPKKASKYHSTPAERGELRFDSQKEPCECGGKYTARAFLDDRVRSSCDKEANNA